MDKIALIMAALEARAFVLAFDPVTMAVLAVAAGAVAGAGKLYEGFAGSAAAKLQAQFAAENEALLAGQAEIAELGVDIAFAKGAFSEMRVREKVGKVLAAQPGYWAAVGLSSTAGTPIALAMDTAMQGQTDIEIVRANAAIEAASARTQVANIRAQVTASAYQGLALEQKAFASMVSGILGAGAAFLSAGRQAGVGSGGYDASGYAAPTPGAPYGTSQGFPIYGPMQA